MKTDILKKIDGKGIINISKEKFFQSQISLFSMFKKRSVVDK